MTVWTVFPWDEAALIACVLLSEAEHIFSFMGAAILEAILAEVDGSVHVQKMTELKSLFRNV